MIFIIITTSIYKKELMKAARNFASQENNLQQTMQVSVINQSLLRLLFMKNDNFDISTKIQYILNKDICFRYPIVQCVYIYIYLYL